MDSNLPPVIPQPDSPPLRSIMGQFLRGRPRGVSQSATAPTLQVQVQDLTRDLSPSPTNQQQAPPSPNPGHRRRLAAIGASIAPTPQSATAATGPSLGLTSMLRRRRSAGTLPGVGLITAAPTATTGPSHRIRLVPHLDSRNSLRFEPISRDLKEGDPALRIGRFTDRSGLGLAAANLANSNKLAFKSKVVSRAHAEIWVESGGKFFIKDTKSSSGTFLNHVRLSPAGAESKQHQLRDGDVLQLGVDYQGGAEDIYKSVKIRIEVGREWQAAANAFNTNAIKQLKSLALAPTATTSESKSVGPAAKTNIPDCCICLFSVTIRQALFIAPCSHAFHYKCIRPLLETHHPAFSCPLCRTFADLEEDVEVDSPHDQPTEDGENATEQQPPTLAVPTITPTLNPTEADREREREAGAETEVEVDTSATRLGVAIGGRRNRPRRGAAPGTMNTVFDLTEPGDADMLDVVVASDEDVDGNAPRSASVSPDPGMVASSSRAVAEESSEGESRGSHEAMEVDSPPSSNEATDAAVGAKRKR